LKFKGRLVYEQLLPEAYRYMNLQPEARLSRRREGKRASETAEERETWLFKRRGRFGARRASQSAIQRERDLQQRREQVLRETVGEGETHLQRMWDWLLRHTRRGSSSTNAAEAGVRDSWGQTLSSERTMIAMGPF